MKKLKVITCSIIATVCISITTSIMASVENIPILQKKELAEQAPIPTKDEILAQINLGISVIEDSIEIFIKNNPNKSKFESFNTRGKSNVEQLEVLKKLKEDLMNDKISCKNAWDKVLEIRDGKK